MKTHVGHKYNGEKMNMTFLNTMKMMKVIPQKSAITLRNDVNEKFQSGGFVMMSDQDYGQFVVQTQQREAFGQGYNDNLFILRVTNLQTKIVLACGIFDKTHEKNDCIVLPEWMLEYMGFKNNNMTGATPQVQIVLMSKLNPIKELTLKPDTAKYFFGNKSQEEIKNMITEKLDNHVALIKGQWLHFINGKDKYWFEVTHCDPPLCKVKLEYGISINTTFEKADDLEQWEGKGVILKAQQRLQEDDFAQQYKQLKQLSENQTNVAATKQRIKQIMDETEKFKENVSQKDQRSLFHTMKKNDSADDTKKQFTGKAYGV